MTISDSTPVQFWPVTDETFNEKVICGLAKQDCYNLDFESEDQIVFQFTDTVFRTYKLIITDSNDNELFRLDFDYQSVDDYYVYSLIMVPSENDLDNAIIRLKIVYSQGEITGAITDYIEEVEGEILSISTPGLYKVANDTISICTEDAVTLYIASDEIFEPGTFIYTDAALTTPVTGFDYIVAGSPSGFNPIYNLGSGNGLVGVDTGDDCIT